MSIKIWIFSDTHYELLSDGVKDDLPVPAGVDLILIAGDYHKATKAVDHARARFGEIPVVMIAGNHEHYKTGMSVEKGINRMQVDSWADRKVNDRVTHVLESETVELVLNDQAVRIIGATLWTDFRLFSDPAGHSAYAQSAMNDYNYIRSNLDNAFELRPGETIQWHRESRAYIRSELIKPYQGKTIVVTHHLPSLRSVAARFKQDPLTPAFASNCSDLLELGADLWIHGHTHDSFDYLAGKTRVLCNPRGYSDYYGRGLRSENKAFNPALIVEV